LPVRLQHVMRKSSLQLGGSSYHPHFFLVWRILNMGIAGLH
jgi:hypothetical protein